MNEQKPQDLTIPSLMADLADQLAQAETPEKIWVACSGGMDSSILLFLLDRLQRQLENFELGILHVNFALRGRESDRDEEVVREAAANYNRELRVLKVDPAQHPPHKAGIQEWARNIRYRWFSEQQGPRDWLAVAHHRDDWVETIFARLCRGHSLMAVSGMQILHERIWRPLLGLSRKELALLGQSLQIAFAEDSSNTSLDYTRNRLRLKILPELEELFPGLAQNIWLHAQDLQDCLQFLTAAMPALPLQETLDFADLKGRPPFLVRHEISRYLRAQIPAAKISRDLLFIIQAALEQGFFRRDMLAPSSYAICQQGILSVVHEQMPRNMRWQQFCAELLDEELDVWPPGEDV